MIRVSVIVISAILLSGCENQISGITTLGQEEPVASPSPSPSPSPSFAACPAHMVALNDGLGGCIEQTAWDCGSNSYGYTSANNGGCHHAGDVVCNRDQLLAACNAGLLTPNIVTPRVWSRLDAHIYVVNPNTCADQQFTAGSIYPAPNLYTAAFYCCNQ